MPKKAKTMPKRKSDTTGTDNRQEASARANRSRIRDFVMRSGGEPFGPPYELGPPSLTEKIVAFFKQKGFFGFETLEKPESKRRRNKFTRYGATRFRGALKKPGKSS